MEEEEKEKEEVEEEIDPLVERIAGLAALGSGDESVKQKLYFSVDIGEHFGKEIGKLKKTCKMEKKSLKRNIGGHEFTGDVSALGLLLPETEKAIKQIKNQIKSIENLCTMA